MQNADAKIGEVIHLGDDIEIVVLKIGKNVVKVGIKAPGMKIKRGELPGNLRRELDARPPNPLD